jgi:outer membrane protein OmpA-like peptidoglycan-associated protein
MISQRRMFLASAAALMISQGYGSAMAQQRPAVDRQDQVAQALPEEEGHRNKQAPEKQSPTGAPQRPGAQQPVAPKSTQQSQPPAGAQQPGRQGQEHRPPLASPPSPEHAQEQRPAPATGQPRGPLTQEHHPESSQQHVPSVGAAPPTSGRPLNAQPRPGQSQTTQQQPPRGEPMTPERNQPLTAPRSGPPQTTQQQPPRGEPVAPERNQSFTAPPRPGQPQTTQQQPPRGGPMAPGPNPPLNAQQRPGQPQTTQEQPPRGGLPVTPAPLQSPRQPPAAAQQNRLPPPGGRTTNPAVSPQQQIQAPPQTAQQSAPQPGTQKLEQVRQERQERVENNGQRTVIQEPGRTIIEENGRAVIRQDETERFRMLGGDIHVEQQSGTTTMVMRRPDNIEVVTIVGPDGRLLRRVRRMPDGREFVLIDNRPRPGIVVGIEGIVTLPPLRLSIPREEYIVDTEELPPQRIVETLEAPPLERLERPYSLDEIRYSVALRDRMRRIDLNTINFDTGSWQVEEDQVPRMATIADAINAVIRRNPNEMFLIEGHTDAVGSDVDNLSLSDRRAESVALVLTQNFQVPPENLTTQGYGAHELKVQTMEPSRENRRVTVRRITPLLTGSAR